MMTFPEVKRLSIETECGFRLKSWPKRMYHRYVNGRLMAGYLGCPENEIHDECGSHNLNKNTRDLSLREDDAVSIILGKRDWETVGV